MLWLRINSDSLRMLTLYGGPQDSIIKIENFSICFYIFSKLFWITFIEWFLWCQTLFQCFAYISSFNPHKNTVRLLSPLHGRNLRHKTVKQHSQAHSLQEGDPGHKPGSPASDPELETIIVSPYVVLFLCFHIETVKVDNISQSFKVW